MTRLNYRAANTQVATYADPELQAIALNQPPLDLDAMKALGQEARRAWMRGWMERMGLPNANQASSLLSLTRHTVERMLYPSRKQNSAVGDQTLHIAYLVEQLRTNSRG